MKRFYERFAKRTLLLFLIIHFNLLSFAAIYYVSNTGSDSNSGASTSTAWQSLAKVNSKTFSADDQILFKRGDTFYGTLNVNQSGTSGHPIIYGAYGTGASPIISGFTTITGWTNQGNGIYSKVISCESATTNIVTVNGVNTAMGRWPNTGYMTYEAFVGHTSITDKQLTNSPNWTGAELVLRGSRWALNKATISNHTNTVLTYSMSWTPDGPNNGYGYFIQNSLSSLDVLGEWYYNGTTFYMYFGANNPDSYTVKISTLDQLVTLGTTGSGSRRDYVTIDGLTFEGSTINSIYIGNASSNLTIKNCTIQKGGRNAVYALYQNSNLLIDNNTIDQINDNAINTASDNHDVTISNNTITNIGSLAGMGGSLRTSLDDQAYDAIICRANSNAIIRNNIIQHIGHSAIRLSRAGYLIQNNTISDWGLVRSDCGAIYTSQADNVTIVGNIILNSNQTLDGIGSDRASTEGIYLDDYTTNSTVSNNSVFNVIDQGITILGSQNIEVSGNTVFACGYAQFRIRNGNSNSQISGLNVHDNIFVAKAAGNTAYPYSPLVAEITNFYNSPSTFGTFDNNYYTRPIDDDDVFRRYDDNFSDPWNGTGLTLSQWKTSSGKEVNSLKSPQSITSESDLQFEYNTTSKEKTVTLSRPMIDVKGTKYSGSITLQPFTSIILMKDMTSAIVASAPTSPVASAGNASASVTFVAPASDGGSAITGYTVTSMPAGGIDSNAGSTSLTHNITGLTNGTSYTFTVKATNSVGSSVASVVSNLVIPTAPVATSFTFTGPSSGNVNSPSANFTVTPNNVYTGTITITPTGAGSAGLSAKVLTFSNSSTAQTFSITPTVAGSITLMPTNNGTLTNPSNLIYNAKAILPNAPTSVAATAGDASALVTFVAPTNTGGSAITGYTVTSIPAGGVDSNAGSTSLTHSIGGLTNGTSYTFTVKAINSVGSSVASIASNSITPKTADVITKQGDIIPSHFKTVWEGLNGLNHMNINVVSATLEDVPLSVDDEIAVFSGLKCVGTTKLTKSIVSSDNTTFLSILASQDDGSGNGFSDNDTIVFKIWDSKTQSELQVNGVVYRNDVSTWKTNGRYSPGATTVVEIASYSVITQSIELLKGYNMISTYVSVQNPNVSAVTKSLQDQGSLIKMQDETGNSFENWGDFGGWINQLGSMEETEGYKIQVANNCTLQVTGRSITMPFDISLKTGWNIISYPRTDMVNAMNVFQALIDQNKLVKVQDEAGNSIENWGLFGGWKNGIGNLIPGKAYKVKISADAILTFQESYPKSAVVLAKAEQTEYYHSSVEGNGTDHMNINITGLNDIGISVGDEIAAFDGSLCVATTKVTEANILSGAVSLASSFSTNDQNSNGFKVGDQIQILIWSKLSGDESKVNTEVITGQMKYEKNASVLVKMKSATLATAITNLSDVVKIDVFPNPCQDRVTIRFSKIPEADSHIEISDVSGRKLITRPISGNTEEINLDSFAPGLYFVKSILGEKEYVQKLIVNK